MAAVRLAIRPLTFVPPKSGMKNNSLIGSGRGGSKEGTKVRLSHDYCGCRLYEQDLTTFYQCTSTYYSFVL